MNSRIKLSLSILAICLFNCGLLLASVNVEAPISKVTVYPDRAMVTRSSVIELPAGDHTVVIENLPNHAQDNSFRASLNSGFGQLLGLKHRVVRHTETPQKKAAELDKSIYELEKYTRQGIIDRRDVFEQQKRMLLSISFKSGEEMSEQLDRGGLEISQWKDAFAFVGDALMAINDSISVTGRELDDIDRLLSKLRDDRRAISAQVSHQSKTVEIEVRLHKEGRIGIDLDYIIDGASWRPVYDARLDDNNEKVELNCFGEVTQRTGEDWTDVDLILSTARPSQGTGPGELNPWTLSVIEHFVDMGVVCARGPKKGIDFLETGTVTIKTQKPILDDAAHVTEPLYGIVSTAYNTSFKVARKVSVPSGDEAVKTPIGNYSLERKVDFLCRPKNREGVYRIATITNHDEAPLLPGPVAIFAGSDYLGMASLNRFVTPGEEFDLPFGKDDNIEVKREMVENKTTSKGDKIRLEQTIRITIVNNSDSGRSIAVEEQLPVSQNSLIKVDLREIKPDRDKSNENDDGKAAWTVNLNPGEEKIITLSYRIEYPAGTMIAGM